MFDLHIIMEPNMNGRAPESETKQSSLIPYFDIKMCEGCPTAKLTNFTGTVTMKGSELVISGDNINFTFNIDVSGLLNPFILRKGFAACLPTNLLNGKPTAFGKFVLFPKLPKELRCMIWKLSLPDQRVIEIKSKSEFLSAPDDHEDRQSHEDVKTWRLSCNTLPPANLFVS